ncbi:MAG: FixH family protein [Hyphomicrobiales bacterium]|nr:FixH family protein [Hyphomicrobiales bacterium]
MAHIDTRAPRPFTGRDLLVWLFAFFGVIFIVNGLFIYFALTSFRGLETESTYLSGRAYPGEIEAARVQAERNWTVNAEIDRDADGSAAVVMHVQDANGAPVSSLDAVIQLSSPLGTAYDKEIAVVETGAGVYRGAAEDVAAGRWTVTINASSAGERVYRSRSTLIIGE